MAQDGLFFKRLGTIHPSLGTPVFSIPAGTAWSSLLAGIGAFDQLLTYVVFVGWIFYALAAASIFVYRKNDPGAARPYRVPGYPYTICHCRCDVGGQYGRYISDPWDHWARGSLPWSSGISTVEKWQREQNVGFDINSRKRK